MLLMRGVDPNKSDFQSQEEADAYQQEIQNQTKALTPQEIEANLSKNFKVIATEWAQNVLTADKKRFYLEEADRESFVDFLLTGRWFRHYKVGYDYYNIEYWRPEEVFFSQEIDTEYPQDEEFVGRLTEMSLSQALVRHGHLMTTRQQEEIGNFFGQSKDFKTGISPTGSEPFATHYVLPFENYFDHQINLGMEDALGAPLAQSMDNDGKVTRHWMPRMDYNLMSPGRNFSRHLRTDIDVRTDTI
jgi:hypothetical protein